MKIFAAGISLCIFLSAGIVAAHAEDSTFGDPCDVEINGHDYTLSLYTTDGKVEASNSLRSDKTENVKVRMELLLSDSGKRGSYGLTLDDVSCDMGNGLISCADENGVASFEINYGEEIGQPTWFGMLNSVHKGSGKFTYSRSKSIDVDLVCVFARGFGR